MKVFAAVVDTGSSAAASNRLDMSRAMTSKYVAHLEEHLGTRLLQRTTRKLTLTESGTACYEWCRIGAMPESGLIARKLASDRIVICGAPSYFKRHGTPQKPADLAHHNYLTYAYAASGDEWKMTGPGGTPMVRVSGNLRATNGDMIKLAALGGAGVMRQPMFLIGPELRAGQLIEVLQAYQSDDIGIYAVYPSRKHLSAKVRTFIDFLSAAFAQKTKW
jgi:DNA-binding transcriptional LysR family regulator